MKKGKQNLTFWNKNKRIILIVLAVAILLLIPLIGNWPWSLSDFIVAGALLLLAGIGIELVMRLSTSKYKAIIIIAILLALFLIWAELAVGLFGTPFAGS